MYLEGVALLAAGMEANGLADLSRVTTVETSPYKVVWYWIQGRRHPTNSKYPLSRIERAVYIVRVGGGKIIWTAETISPESKG